MVNGDIPPKSLIPLFKKSVISGERFGGTWRDICEGAKILVVAMILKNKSFVISDLF